MTAAGAGGAGQVPCVLRDGGAALLNLSLLASDLWAAAARTMFFGGRPGHPALKGPCNACWKAPVVPSCHPHVVLPWQGRFGRLGRALSKSGQIATLEEQNLKFQKRQAAVLPHRCDQQEAKER